MEDQKTDTAVARLAAAPVKFGWVAPNWALDNWLNFALVVFNPRPLTGDMQVRDELPFPQSYLQPCVKTDVILPAPSCPAHVQILFVGAAALQCAMLLGSVAGAGPCWRCCMLEVEGTRRVGLALACLDLQAYAVVSHCLDTLLMGLLLFTAQGDSHFLLCLFVAAGVIFFAVADLRGFMALLRVVGEEQQQEE